MHSYLRSIEFQIVFINFVFDIVTCSVNYWVLIFVLDEPDIFIKGENEIICGGTAQIEAEVRNVESSFWSITWQKRRGNVINCIDTNMEKYSGSTKKKLVINSVCKEDEGEYQAVLSLESNGPEYKSRNIIRLHAIGGKLVNKIKQHTCIIERGFGRINNK